MCVVVVCEQGSRRSDEEALEDQVRKLGEELRGVRELYQTEQDRTRNSQEEVLQLHNQVLLHTELHHRCCSPTRSLQHSVIIQARHIRWEFLFMRLTMCLIRVACVLQMATFSVEMCSVQEESERMRAMSEARDPSEQLQSAIQDRDDAISK